jgi:GTP-binding protein LepA
VIDDREKKAQYLDRMDIERERGITIKAQACACRTRADDGVEYAAQPDRHARATSTSPTRSAQPGRLRGRAAGRRRRAGRRGPDAGQRVPGAREQPRDHPGHQQDRPAERRRRPRAPQIEELIGLDTREAAAVRPRPARDRASCSRRSSAHPAAQGRPRRRRCARSSSTRGTTRTAASSRSCACSTARCARATDQDDGHRQAVYDVIELGVYAPTPKCSLTSGPARSATFIANIKEVARLQGRRHGHPLATTAAEALPGFQEVQPMVFCGVFPTDGELPRAARRARQAARSTTAPSSSSPRARTRSGFGFRCGFLGLLHMEIVQERLEREYDLDLITTAPSVKYRVHLKKGEVIVIDNPAQDAGRRRLTRSRSR